MAHHVEFTEAAEQDLEALPRDIGTRIYARVVALGDRPRPRGSSLLQGSRTLRRLRVGACWAIYQADDAQQVVTIARVRRRRDKYRGL